VKQTDEMREAAEKEQWDECLERWQAALKTEPQHMGIRFALDTTACRCQSKAGHTSEAITLCTEVIQKAIVDTDKFNALCERADAHILLDDFDAGALV
jgi:hypothetical protein